MKTLEQLYLDKASECQAKGDAFGAAYWRKRFIEIKIIGE